MEKKVIGRRDFMKSTLAGFGGFYFLTLNEPKQEEKPFDIKGKEKKLVYRTLGRTGLNLPVINMGVMNSDNPNLIRTALDSGIRLLDTAHAYMQGRNEEVIGSVVKGRPRDSYYIGSKVSLPHDRTTGRYLEGATEAEFIKKLDLSLKRLGQCVARLPIPDLMRAYMYVYDYRNLGMAQDLVVSLGLPAELCGDCSRCPVRCPSGFDVKAKIRDIVRLREIPAEYFV
ncbi:MAG: aldo/keto reductase [Proteobacteria bacterium]|nr:aldo/keto reductase [Pseudomonadota bacterium]MBU4370640.1 aldo/keto reductase [Pseudomonadota bacterium]MBU4583002.1 aldo/keto reductase [Pseudomonadota bacterium]